MAAGPSEGARLVASLSGAAGPFAKLRVVLAGVGALAKLPRERRRRLLVGVGLGEAEGLVDRLVESEAARAAAHRALDEIETDPGRVKRLVKDLANPGTRAATLAGLLAWLESTLPSVRAGSSEAEDEAASDAEALGTDAPATVAPAAAAPSPSPAREAAPVPPALPPPVPGATEATRPAEPTRPPPPAEVPPVAPLRPASPDRPPAFGPTAPEPLPARLVVSPPPGGFDPRSASRPAARLAAWRALVAGPEPDEAVLASFADWAPGGWERRRALQALFAAGRPAAAAAALDLLAGLDAPDLRWCLPVLVRSRRWSEEELATITATVAEPAWRARLERTARLRPAREGAAARRS